MLVIARLAVIIMYAYFYSTLHRAKDRHLTRSLLNIYIEVFGHTGTSYCTIYNKRYKH